MENLKSKEEEKKRYEMVYTIGGFWRFKHRLKD